MRRRPRPFELRDGLRTGLRTGCRHAPGRPRPFRRSVADLLPRHLRRLPRREASGRVSGSPLPASELTKTARVGLETTHIYARSLSFKGERSASLAHSPRELGLPSVRRQVFYSKQPHPLPTFATISIFVGAYYTIQSSPTAMLFRAVAKSARRRAVSRSGRPVAPLAKPPPRRGRGPTSRQSRRSRAAVPFPEKKTRTALRPTRRATERKD